MMPRLRYEQARDVCCIVHEILGQGLFPYIDPTRIHCVRSHGSQSRAIARIHGLTGAWIAAGLQPGYVIEVIAEHYDHLPFEDKVKVVIHELLHIPTTFSGALRPHGKHVNSRRVSRLARKLNPAKLGRCNRFTG